MLIDEVTIKISGGKGGNGCVAFDKSKGGRGPTGANGGRGGDVYIRAVDDLTVLNNFRFKKDFDAENGKDGQNRLLDGRSGKDLFLRVPIGTIAHNLKNGKDLEVIKKGEELKLASGGKGGRGNWFFRSSTNTTPKEWEEGTKGEEFEIKLELRLIAQIGLIGFPSAGKSTLLNSLTKANVKTAAYPFTTLEPNLGDFYGTIIADLPGLIENASEGKGLGIRFLKHIKRTNILIHCVSSESENLEKEYKTIREELEKYSKELGQQREYVFLTKTDLIDEKEKEEKLKILKKLNKNTFAVSTVNDAYIKTIRKIFTDIIKDNNL